jgi:hypothetical protein
LSIPGTFGSVLSSMIQQKVFIPRLRAAGTTVASTSKVGNSGARVSSGFSSVSL